MSSDEEKLIERLRSIETLFPRSVSETESPIEFRFSLPDQWSHRLLIALLRRYGITAYRYSGQRYSTIMIRASDRFIQETLIPEYDQLRAVMASYFDEVAERVFSQALSANSTKPENK